MDQIKDAGLRTGSSPGVDGRDHERVSIDAFVKAWDRDTEYVFRTRDLSRGGLFLCTMLAYSYPFGVGSTLDLELFHQDVSVTCKVEVVRIVEPGSPEAVNYPAGFGVKISHVDRENRKRLKDLIAQYTGEEPDPEAEAEAEAAEAEAEAAEAAAAEKAARAEAEATGEAKSDAEPARAESEAESDTDSADALDPDDDSAARAEAGSDD